MANGGDMGETLTLYNEIECLYLSIVEMLYRRRVCVTRIKTFLFIIKS